MKIKLITCMVLSHEVYYLAYKSQHTISIDTIPQKLHCTPELLKTVLQEIIDKAEMEDDYDAICFAYGLCSNATVGLYSNKVKLVIPKAHDCIALLLGDRDKYNKLFKKYNGGAYWYSKGWVSNDLLEMPSPRHFEMIYDKYSKIYDEEIVGYLIETEKKWAKMYNTAVFIKWDDMDSEDEQKETAKIAEALDLEYIKEEGSNDLLRRLINGEWGSKDFLIVPTGHYIVPSYDDEIVTFSKEEPNVS